MNKYAIIGSRSFRDYGIMERELDKILIHGDEIVSGGAIGADTLACQYADRHGVPVQVILPDWKTHGRSAGFIRNQQIIDQCTAVIAFWDGNSRGTAHSMSLAKKAEKPVLCFNFKGEITENFLFY